MLVAMRLAPVNPADLLLIAGRYAFAPTYPAVPGAEGVGEVLAVGAGVTDLVPGMRVLPLTRGNWTSHRLLPAADLVPVPAGLADAQAALLRINPATAWRLLHMVPLRAGDPVLLNAPGSGVAGLVRHFAAGLGVPVIDIGRAGSGHTFCDGPDLAARLAARCAVLALDCVAGEATGRLAACLAPGGTLLVYGHLSGQPCQVPSTLLTGRGLSIRGFSLRPAEAADPDIRGFYRMLAARLDGMPLIAPVRGVWPLSALGEAVTAARGPGAGRVLLDLAA
ncbi:alcohol dehydrogenase catalytic domain-containing protein [Niveispirillum fermenti]|uniref:alcohol dehydrogenase catalytic domain-containing protein n=1 Tax=Niveispirillum fermenti TaxID=1233113 RepID=UPI003A8A6AE6